MQRTEKMKKLSENTKNSKKTTNAKPAYTF